MGKTSRVLILGALAITACGDDSATGPTDAAADGMTMDGATDGDAGSDGSMGDGGLPDTPDRFLPALVSGSRLQAKVIVGEGADPVFYAWWDSELEVYCDFAYATDGRLRCLPLLPGNSPTGHVSATCDDDPIVVNFRPECGEATHVQLSTMITPACGHEGLVNEVRSVTPISAPTAYYDGVVGSCDGPRDPPPEGTFGRTDAVVPPDAFVAGELETVPDGDALGVQRWVAEDGARRTVRGVDPRYGPCGPSHALAIADRGCLPIDNLYSLSDVYADDACTVPVVATRPPALPECGDLPEVVYTFETLASGGTMLTIGRRDTEITGPVFRRSGDTCVETPLADVMTPGTDHVYRVVPLEMLPLDSAPRGAGPMRTLYLVRDDGVFLFPGIADTPFHGATAYFEEAGERCAPVAFPDDSLACLPSEHTVHALLDTAQYADAGCTEPLAVIPPSQPLPDAATTLFFQDDYEACASVGPVLRVRDVVEADAEYTGPVYMGTPSDCYSVTPNGPYYRMGASVRTELTPLSLTTLE